MLVHQVPSHIHALNGGKTHFYEENRIRRIVFNFEIRSYKALLVLLNLPPKFSITFIAPYFTTIQDNCKLLIKIHIHSNFSIVELKAL